MIRIAQRVPKLQGRVLHLMGGDALRFKLIGRCNASGFWAAVRLLAALCFAGAFVAHAQFAPPPPERLAGPGGVLARSHSGQFVIQSLHGSMMISAVPKLGTNRNLIHLDPTLLPISAERIKQILCRELGAPNRWEGKIFLTLYPTHSEEDTITVESDLFRDRWQYRVLLPEVVDRARYVEAMTQVILLEMANRQAGAHSAEIPAWLTEGFCQHLLAANAREIIVSPPGKGSGFLPLGTNIVDAVREDPLKQAHQRLCAATPLTFQELSWPSSEQLSGEAMEVYRSSAQLFVTELLRLKSGDACLCAMISELPQHYNWQFAFLHAFQEHFQRPLDVEKWWTLHLVHFTGRELEQTWPLEESWEKLEQSIRSAVQVRSGTNELPLRAEVSLQTIIREWDPVRQKQALQGKLRELAALRLRLAQRLVPLADEYQRSLESYLALYQHPGGILPFRKGAARRQAAQQTLQQLDALDGQLLEMRPAPPADATIQADAGRSPN